jgi:hypothetical protein
LKTYTEKLYHINTQGSCYALQGIKGWTSAAVFYSYKMREYRGGNINALRQDLLLGSELSDDDLLKLSKRIGWVSWEDLAEVIFQYESQVDNIPFDELRQFYQERNVAVQRKVDRLRE